MEMGRVPCAIALGSNLGDSEAILQGAIATLQAHPAIHHLIPSRLYRTAPVGPPQPDYLNGCACFETDLPPLALLHLLLSTEAQFGRVRRQRWGPRHLDLDLLLYGDRVETSLTLELPHPRMAERPFVLIPLAEIAPHWLHPTSGHTIAQLRHHLCSEAEAPGVTLFTPALSRPLDSTP